MITTSLFYDFSKYISNTTGIIGFVKNKFSGTILILLPFNVSTWLKCWSDLKLNKSSVSPILYLTDCNIDILSFSLTVFLDFSKN